VWSLREILPILLTGRQLVWSTDHTNNQGDTMVSDSQDFLDHMWCRMAAPDVVAAVSAVSRPAWVKMVTERTASARAEYWRVYIANDAATAAMISLRGRANHSARCAAAAMTMTDPLAVRLSAEDAVRNAELAAEIATGGQA
jgi:hypothetical protein